MNIYKLFITLMMIHASTNIFGMDQQIPQSNTNHATYENLLKNDKLKFTYYQPSTIFLCCCPWMVQAQASVNASNSITVALLHINKNIQAQNILLADIANKIPQTINR